MEKSANLKMESENPEDTEPVSKVLAQALENIEFLGLEKEPADPHNGGGQLGDRHARRNS